MNVSQRRTWARLSLALFGLLLTLATSLPGAFTRDGGTAPPRSAAFQAGAAPTALGDLGGPYATDDRAAEAPADPSRSSLAALREFAQQHAHALDGLVHLTAAERSALQADERIPPARQAARQGEPSQALEAIPDRLEGERPTRQHADALAAVRISTSLGLWQGPPPPFELLAIRTGPGPARIQARALDGAAPASMPGWFELGESPSTGWRVVQITAHGAVLLSPFGNLLPLELPGELAGQAQSHAATQLAPGKDAP